MTRGHLIGMLSGFLLLASATPSQADILQYTWNDDFTGSTFYGYFTVDTTRLVTAGGVHNLLTANAIEASYFQFARNSLGIPVYFGVGGVYPGAIQIDPTTGAVLGSGEILFGSSTVATLGQSTYQLIRSRAQFDTNYNVSFGRGFGGGQRIYAVAAYSGEFFASVGHWDVNVIQHGSNPIPAPPGILLIAFALGGLAIARRRTKVAENALTAI